MQAIDYTVEQDGIIFRDRITLTDEEYAAMTVEQIDAIKTARFAAHVEAMDGGE